MSWRIDPCVVFHHSMLCWEINKRLQGKKSMTITFFGWIPTPTALSDFVEQTLIYQGLSVEFAALWLDEKIYVVRFLKKIDPPSSRKQMDVPFVERFLFTPRAILNPVLTLWHEKVIGILLDTSVSIYEYTATLKCLPLYVLFKNDSQRKSALTHNCKRMWVKVSLVSFSSKL